MTIFSEFYQWFPLILVLAGVGMVAGTLAGLMGIGGGIILVPGLYYSMTALGHDPANLMHMAIGTSLAIMIPTGISSTLAHRKKGAVDLCILKNVGGGVVLGVGMGTGLAHYLSGDDLQIFFSCVLMGLAFLMISAPARYSVFHGTPGQPWATLSGTIIGVISSLMGIGGTVMNVPFLRMCRIPMHKAVGTSAAQGLLVSIPGCLGFIIIGGQVTNLPPLSLGYVNVMAWMIITPFSIIMTPLGVRLAYKLPAQGLHNIFAILLFFIAGRMLYEAFYSSI